MAEINLKETVVTDTKTFFAGKVFASDEDFAAIKAVQEAGSTEEQVLLAAQEDKRESAADDKAKDSKTGK